MFYVTDIRGIPYMIQGSYYSFSDWNVASHITKALRVITKKDLQVHYIGND
jgi:hypothetical protein